MNPTVVMTAMGKKAWSDPNKAAGMLSRIPLGRFVGKKAEGCLQLHSSELPLYVCRGGGGGEAHLVPAE